MSKDIVRTRNAPAPIGPYSQAVKLGGLVFVAGQGGKHPVSGDIPSDVQGQSRQVMENLKAILEAAGSSMDKVVKTTCYLSDMDNFAAFNEIYGQYFASEPPARTTIQAARLPMDILVEVEVIASV